MTTHTLQSARHSVRAAALAAGLALCSMGAQAVVIELVSNSSWLSTDNAAAGWQQSGPFDTSGWVAARAPYPSPAAGLPNSTAQTIWHDPGHVSTNGGGGVSTAWFRRLLNLDLAAAGQHVASALVRLRVDDDYAFYVNGVLAMLNADQGHADRVQTVDVTALLHDGENLFAIQAVDGGWGNPSNRSYQGLLVDARIDVVPEPASLALVLAALLAAGLVRRQR